MKNLILDLEGKKALLESELSASDKELKLLKEGKLSLYDSLLEAYAERKGLKSQIKTLEEIIKRLQVILLDDVAGTLEEALRLIGDNSTRVKIIKLIKRWN